MATYALRDPVPVLDTVELLVIGGGLEGLAAARRGAQRGLRTLLAEAGTHLMPEMGGFLRPWLYWREADAPLLRTWFPIPEDVREGTECALPLDDCKRMAEDRLLASGARLLYGLRAVGCRGAADGFEVLFASRQGLFLVRARRVAHCCGETPCGITRICAEFEGADCVFGSLPVPERFDLAGNAVTVHPSARAENRIVEMAFDSARVRDPALPWRIAVEVSEHLLAREPSFVQARFGAFSETPMTRKAFSPAQELRRGEALGSALADSSRRYAGPPLPDCMARRGERIPQSSIVSAGPVIYARNETAAYRGLDRADIRALTLPEESCEAAVAGGGTGGAVAAYTAAQEGARTTLVEMNALPGGTGTVGGVHSYWFGDRQGFTKELDDEVFALQDRLRDSGQKVLWGERDSWNPWIKAYVLLERCVRAGVRLRAGEICAGVLREGDRAAGILAAGPEGLRAIRARVVVDATGDGDAAALAGAEYQYGNDRDRMTMWSCLAQFRQAGVYRGGIFSTSADIGDPMDITRYLLVNRRRYTEDCYDHGTYLCTRESRHIRGDATVTLRDVAARRRYADAVVTCQSNADCKGKSTADLIYFGYLVPQCHVEIPYGAFLPRGLEGMLVIGKAISATHDALPIVRMQDDVQNQGGMAGTAAALCIQSGRSPRAVSLAALQERMREKGALRPLSKAAQRDPAAYAAALDGNEPEEYIDADVRLSFDESDRLLCVLLAEPALVLPVLRERFAKAQGALRLLLARLLLWHGDEAGLPDLLEEIARRLHASPALAPRTGSVSYCQAQPDHGVMCEVTYLLNLLSRAKSPKILPVFELLCERIEHTRRDYLDIRQSIFSHIECVAYAAERTGLAEFAPLLERLLALDEFRTCALEGFDTDITFERVCCLRLALLRALARLGEISGYRELAGLTGDARMVVAKSAADELSRLTGVFYGLDTAKWERFIADPAFIPGPRPVEGTIW